MNEPTDSNETVSFFDDDASMELLSGLDFESWPIAQRAVGVARAALQRIIDFGAADQAAQAATALGQLELENHNASAARAAFALAVASGHADVVPLAASRLGPLEEEAGNIDAALEAYRTASESQDEQYSVPATYSLALLERSQGNVQQAREGFTKAVSSGDAEIAPTAGVNLGDLEREQGRVNAARARFKRPRPRCIPRRRRWQRSTWEYSRTARATQRQRGPPLLWPSTRVIGSTGRRRSCSSGCSKRWQATSRRPCSPSRWPWTPTTRSQPHRLPSTWD